MMTCPDCGEEHLKGKRCTRCSAKHATMNWNKNRRHEYLKGNKRQIEIHRLNMLKRVEVYRLENEIITKLEAMETSVAQLKSLFRIYRNIKRIRPSRILSEEQ